MLFMAGFSSHASDVWSGGTWLLGYEHENDTNTEARSPGKSLHHHTDGINKDPFLKIRTLARKKNLLLVMCVCVWICVQFGCGSVCLKLEKISAHNWEEWVFFFSLSLLSTLCFVCVYF